MLTKKRLLLTAGFIATVGSGVALVAGVTFGFFSATTPTQTNTFAAGTVSLTQSAVTSCNIAHVQPGDSGSCHFTVAYTGNVSDGAWLGVDLGITGTAGTPVQAYAPGNGGVTPAAAPGLYDSTVNGLQVTISDNQTTPVAYMSGTSWNGANTGYASGASIADLLVNPAAFTAPTSMTFTISWSLPTSANNSYDNATTALTMIVHAVQAGNNGSTTGCLAGDTCSGISSWS
jgi:hypothetical protein